MKNLNAHSVRPRSVAKETEAGFARCSGGVVGAEPLLKSVIFDMDGVLIDSQPLHYQIDIRVIQACGYPADLDTVTPYTGISNQDRWPKYREELNLSPSPEQLIEMAEQAMRDIFNETKLVASPGIPALLKGIKEMGLHCGVASASSHELIQLVLNRTGIAQYFDAITSGEDVSVSKPAPDVYLRAAGKAGYPPAQCIAVEDAPVGILAAKNAGFTCIAYKNPNTFGQDFTFADHVIDHFDQCLPIIRNLGGSTPLSI